MAKKIITSYNDKTKELAEDKEPSKEEIKNTIERINNTMKHYDGKRNSLKSEKTIIKEDICPHWWDFNIYVEEKGYGGIIKIEYECKGCKITNTVNLTSGNYRELKYLLKDELVEEIEKALEEE